MNTDQKEKKQKQEEQRQNIIRKITFHAWLHLPCGNVVENSLRTDCEGVTDYKYRYLKMKMLIIMFLSCWISDHSSSLCPLNRCGLAPLIAVCRVRLWPVKETEMNWDVLDHHFPDIHSTCGWLLIMTTAAPCRDRSCGSVSVRLVSRLFLLRLSHQAHT